MAGTNPLLQSCSTEGRPKAILTRAGISLQTSDLGLWKVYCEQRQLQADHDNTQGKNGRYAFLVGAEIDHRPRLVVMQSIGDPVEHPGGPSFVRDGFGQLGNIPV
jgi:hypothetical protein